MLHRASRGSCWSFGNRSHSDRPFVRAGVAVSYLVRHAAFQTLTTLVENTKIRLPCKQINNALSSWTGRREEASATFMVSSPHATSCQSASTAAEHDSLLSRTRHLASKTHHADLLNDAGTGCDVPSPLKTRDDAALFRVLSDEMRLSSAIQCRLRLVAYTTGQPIIARTTSRTIEFP